MCVSHLVVAIPWAVASKAEGVADVLDSKFALSCQRFYRGFRN